MAVIATLVGVGLYGVYLHVRPLVIIALFGKSAHEV